MNTNKDMVVCEYKGKFICEYASFEGFYIQDAPEKDYKSLRAAKMAVTRALTKASNEANDKAVDERAIEAHQQAEALDSIATTTEPVVLASEGLDTSEGDESEPAIAEPNNAFC